MSISILLSPKWGQKRYEEALQTITDKCQGRFNKEQIENVFSKLREVIKLEGVRSRYKYLLETTFESNEMMFFAIISYIGDNDLESIILLKELFKSYTINSNLEPNIGFNYVYMDPIACVNNKFVDIMISLLNYNEFSFTEFIIHETTRLYLEEYTTKKYRSGKLTKRAIK